MSRIPEESYAEEREYVISKYPNAELEVFTFKKFSRVFVVKANDKNAFTYFIGMGRRIDKAWKDAARKTKEFFNER